jgi:hypothetical protein
MRRMALKAKRIFNCLSGRESGQILIMVLIMALLGAVILMPLLSFTIGGMKQGQSNEEKKNEFYAADSGVEDAMWKIRNYTDADWPSWMTGTWTEATYANSPAYWEYSIAQPAVVNGKDVTVRIQPTWILTGMEDPNYSADKRTLDDNVTVTGSVTAAGKYEVVILKDATFTNPLIIDRIGVWLPTGFNYVAGSSNLESLTDPMPPGGSRCTPTVVPFRNGKVIIWDYSTPINYSQLLADKSGVANSRKLNHLVDSVNNQFTAADEGRSIYNATDDKWGLITAYNSPSDVTVSPDIFDNGNERYEIGDANRRVVSFSFTSTSSASVPDGAFCWVRSPGNTTPHVAPYLWWSAGKVYQIVSKGVDPSTGKLTTITAYTTKEELKEFGEAVNADYWATGNTLMRCTTGNAQGRRDRLYDATSAQIAETTQPGDPGVLQGANVLQLRLYWTGWKNYPWNAWPLTDAQRSALVSQNLVDRVLLKVEADGVVYEDTIVADSWQVLPNGNSGSPHGWSYACYADVTDRVLNYFAAQGVTFTGHGTFTVGHADTSVATTQPLQGVWGVSGSDVFSVGASGTIVQYDGSNWNWMTSGTTSNLYGVWGSSSTNVFAVGASGTILHYDGSTWASMTSGTSSDLRGVWGSDASHVFAVGASGTVRYYNGSSWGNAPGTTGSGTTTQLNGVWGSAYTNVFVVGASGSIRHYNGSAWSSMIGAYPVYQWKDSHSGETVQHDTDYPLGNSLPYPPPSNPGPSDYDEWAYAGWSVVVIYSHPELTGHQLYIDDTFRYCDNNQTLTCPIANFLAPQDVLTDPNAARLTAFVGEGDLCYTGDELSVNGTYLFDAVNPINNVWNSRSNVLPSSANDGIDIDTFSAGNGIIQPGDTSAVVKMPTGTDSWNLVYIILSFRSNITSGGIASIKIT